SHLLLDQLAQLQPRQGAGRGPLRPGAARRPPHRRRRRLHRPRPRPRRRPGRRRHADRRRRLRASRGTGFGGGNRRSAARPPAARGARLMRWAALLRGVNVGGNRKLPMADLKGLVEALGFERVETLLASGNVVFDAAGTDGAELQTLLERKARERLGLETDFLLRDAKELKAAIDGNPFAEAAGRRPGQLLVVFARKAFPA